ncbi:MAG: XdhC family protein [Desulfobacterales bacterium]|nr:XdhC family protein [Desulfobacterales bacterium]
MQSDHLLSYIMPMKQLYQTISALMAEKRPFALATILSSHGSTPRTSGTRMIVFSDKSIRGTIGGGLIEAQVIDTCADMLKDDTASGSLIKDYILNQDLKSGMDMVCGGELRVWIEIFGPQCPADIRETLDQMAEAERKGSRLTLVTTLAPEADDKFSVTKKQPVDEKNLPPELRTIIGNSMQGGVGCLTGDGETIIAETLAPVPVLYIFGGGHVGYALAEMAHLIDMPCVIVDDREAFSNAERFPHARSVVSVPEFRNCFDGLTPDEHSYIVIMTRGHLHDEVVLEQALATKAAYIGMIGSRRKRDTIYAHLRERGFSNASLEKVHSPIGLSINSETPAEIAVSIIAQIIRAKRSGIKGASSTTLERIC